MRLNIAIEARLLDCVVHKASYGLCNPSLVFSRGGALVCDPAIIAAGTAHGAPIITNANLWPKAFIRRRRTNQLETILSTALLHVLGRRVMIQLLPSFALSLVYLLAHFDSVLLDQIHISLKLVHSDCALEVLIPVILLLMLAMIQLCIASRQSVIHTVSYIHTVYR